MKLGMFFLYALLINMTFGQSDSTPLHKNIDAYIPKGFEVVKSEEEKFQHIADFNSDGILDYIVLLAKGHEIEDYSDIEDVKLLILEGQENGSFIPKSQTGNLTSTFIYYLSNEILGVLENEVIVLRHQSMRHDFELKIRYEKKYKEYMLIGSEYNNYASGAGTGAGNVSINFLTGKKISTIDGKITKINIDKNLKPISMINFESAYDFIDE